MSDCIFCSILKGEAPASVVYQDEDCIAFMDLFPMRPGHVLVIPRQHGVFIDELTPALRAHLVEVCHWVIKAQKASGLPCDGNNVFLNDGPAANQHVPHVHFHVLPRRQGDLAKAVLSFATRYTNYFGQAAHRKRLDDIAASIARHMPQRVRP
ncbi:MAG: HIT family protein [Pseudomonadota bacterium]|nr:HIT family protein [Pseudomonadota bacterium]